MQHRIGLAVVLALGLAAVPAPAGEHTALTPLPGEQRGASSEGQSGVGCANVAVNVAVLSPGAIAQTGTQTIAATGNESAAHGTCRRIAVNVAVLSPGVTQRTGAQALNCCRTRRGAAGERLAVDAR